MVDESKSTSTANSTFTAGETKLLVSIMKHLEGDLKSDFAAVAAECGLKDANVAKVRWGQIKRKKIAGAAVTAGICSGSEFRGVTKKTAAATATTTKRNGKGGGRGRPKSIKKEKPKVEDMEGGDGADMYGSGGGGEYLEVKKEGGGGVSEDEQDGGEGEASGVPFIKEEA